MLALALTLTSATGGPAALDSLIAFKNTERCMPTEQFGSFQQALARYDASDRPQQGELRVPPHLAEALGPLAFRRMDGWAVAEVPVEGTWRGIPVVRLVFEFPDGGDPWSQAIRFRTDLATLTRVANEAGFPPSGTVHDDEVYETSVSFNEVPDQPGIVELRCDIG